MRCLRGFAIAGAAAVTLLAALALAASAEAGASLPLDASVEGSLGLVHAHSAMIRTTGVVVISGAVSLDGGREAAPDGAASDVPACAALRLSASAGVLPWLEVSLDAAAVRTTSDGPDAGLALPALSVKAGGETPLRGLHVAVEGRAELPSGSEVVADIGGEALLLTGGDADLSVLALATLDLTDRFPVRFHANAGWALRGNEDRGRALFPGTYPSLPGADPGDNDALLVRGGVEFPGRRVTLFTEVRGDLLRDRSAVALKENPLLVTPGVRLRFGDWAATAALSVGLSGNDRSTSLFDPFEAYPDWVLTASLSWGWSAFAPDRDADGVEDYRDLCPLTPEDADGHRDADGCPDPDNDGDGVPDIADLAPLEAEDLDGFEDEDGLPDPDNDGDGIPDGRDMCPDEGEDFDGFEDEDGCPDR